MDAIDTQKVSNVGTISTFEAMFRPYFIPEFPDDPTNESIQEFMEQVEEIEDIWDVNSHLLTVLGIVVMIENVFVMMAFIAHKQLRVLHNTFLLSLSLAEFLYSLFSCFGSLFLDSPKVSTFSVITCILCICQD